MNESLQTLSMVSRLKEELSKNPNFLRDQIKPMMLDNPHCALVKMIPSENYEKEQVKLEEELLSTHLQDMTEIQKRECFDIELDLEEEQAEAPNVDCLPTLTIHDIPSSKKRFQPVQTDDLIHYQQTSGSGLTYIRGVVELDGLTASEVDLLPIYEAVLTRIGRGGYDYRQIGVEQDLSSGGFSCSTGILTDYENVDVARPALNFYTYGLDSNLERMMTLFDSLLTPDGPDFDADRIRVVINETYSSVQGGIVGSGHSYSMAHSHSYINSYGNVNERLGGLTAVKNLKELIDLDDWSGLSERLTNLHRKITAQHARFLVHGDNDDSTAAVKNLSGIRNRATAPIPTASPLIIEKQVKLGRLNGCCNSD